MLKGYIGADAPADAPIPLADIWAAVNEVRPMGAAPFIDAIAYCRASAPEFDFFVAATPEMQGIFLGAFQVFVLPMLDGIAREHARAVATDVGKAIALTENDVEHLKRRLDALAL